MNRRDFLTGLGAIPLLAVASAIKVDAKSKTVPQENLAFVPSRPSIKVRVEKYFPLPDGDCPLIGQINQDYLDTFEVSE